MNAFLSKISGKEKIGLFIAAAFLLLAFFDRLIIHPIAARIKQIDQGIAISEKQLEKDLRYLKQKGIVTEEYQKCAQYVKKVGSDEEEQTKVLGEIEELARQCRISIINIKPQAPRQIGFYKKYVVDVESEAETEPFMNFLYQLNNSSQLLRAERAGFNLKDKDSLIVKGSITVTKVVIP